MMTQSTVGMPFRGVAGIRRLLTRKKHFTGGWVLILIRKSIGGSLLSIRRYWVLLRIRQITTGMRGQSSFMRTRLMRASWGTVLPPVCQPDRLTTTETLGGI